MQPRLKFIFTKIDENLNIFLEIKKKAVIFALQIWEISSAGSEHLPYKQGVTGSNPVSPTTHLNGGFFVY